MSRIVVLGGAGIIGRAIAQDLARDVAEVIVTDLDQVGAQVVTEAVGRRPGQVVCLRASGYD
jgi:nucleoside-diphosphate-sugar epimerase